MLAHHLRELTERESITAGDTALRLIARASEGSVRDAVALLDQLATYGSGEISDDDAASVLGGVDRSVHHRLLSSILAGSSADVTTVVAEIDEQGWDPRHVFSEFLSYCRDALHLSLGVSAEAIELPEDETERLATLAGDAGYENLLRLLHQLLGSEGTVRRSDSGTLAIEIAWLRAAELPKLTRIEELLSDGPKPSAALPPASREVARVPSVSTPAKPKRKPHKKPRPQAQQATEEIPEQDNPGAPSAPVTEDGEVLARLIEEVSRRRQSLAAHIGGVENLAFSDGEVQIYEDPNDNNWLKNALSRGKNRQVLEESLAAVLGGGARWRLLQAERPGSPSTPVEEQGAPDPLLSHPRVQTALDIFGGTAHTAKTEEG